MSFQKNPTNYVEIKRGIPPEQQLPVTEVSLGFKHEYSASFTFRYITVNKCDGGSAVRVKFGKDAACYQPEIIIAFADALKELVK